MSPVYTVKLKKVDLIMSLWSFPKFYNPVILIYLLKERITFKKYQDLGINYKMFSQNYVCGEVVNEPQCEHI